MRSGENPLDLNNLPDDYGRDGKQITEDSSSNTNSLPEPSDASRCRKKKNGGKDECGKVYECRFCSLKFCKSQALGGHMNRHRQERETETLNRARQLVFSNDAAAQGGPGPGPHLGGAQVMPGNMIDPSLQYRGGFPARLYSSSSPTILSPIQPATPQPATPQGAYLYTPSSRFMSFPAPLPTSHNYPDYYVGHVLPPNRRGPAGEASYTCIGAPVGQNGAVQGEDGHCYDHSSLNRFSDGL